MKFTVDQMRKIMDQAENIRNLSVIAHVDHGKSTLTDSLIAAAGIISVEDAGNTKVMDTRPDEKERGITIKSTGISLYFEHESESSTCTPISSTLSPIKNNSTDNNNSTDKSNSTKKPYVINLIDSPGHVDFSSEVTAALRVTDGALVVVDIVEGVCVQTETVLRQALSERIVPVLVINKLDRGFLELQLLPEDMYRNLSRVIESTNALIATYSDPDVPVAQMDPLRGNVSFAAGLHGWAFNLQQFARMYTRKSGGDPQKLVKRMWGDHFFDTTTKTWSTESGPNRVRGFCHLILDPIRQVFQAAMRNDLEQLEKMLSGFGIELSLDDRAKTEKALLKCVMQKWLSADHAILEMAVQHLPSPVAAQHYRAPLLYSGPQDDPYAKAIATCLKDGPLVVYISKMVPTPDKAHFFAFGRVFSGTLRAGQKVRVLGPDYDPSSSSPTDVFTKTAQRTVIMMGRKTEPVDSVPCGNTVALIGIDSVLHKTGTLVDPSATDAHPIVAMKFSVSAVVRVAVKPEKPSEVGKLAEALKRLAKADSLVVVSQDSHTHEHLVSGAGELHLEICLRDLQEDYMGGSKIIVSPPVVSYRETVSAASSKTCISRSGNGHNRMYATACPLDENLTSAIEAFKIQARDEPKARARLLHDEYNWDLTEARKIWAFGPSTTGPNLLVDCTKSVNYLNEIRDSLITSFQLASSEGHLMAEPLRGVRFDLHDFMIHSDPPHRGAGQIIPMARRNLAACQLSAAPRIQEPMFLVEIQCPESVIGTIYTVMNQRRGIVVDQVQRFGTPLVALKAHMPVAESFGFNACLRQETGGRAFPQCVFSHWKELPTDPTDTSSKAHKIVLDARKRKGLELHYQPLEKLVDRIH